MLSSGCHPTYWGKEWSLVHRQIACDAIPSAATKKGRSWRGGRFTVILRANNTEKSNGAIQALSLPDCASYRVTVETKGSI